MTCNLDWPRALAAPTPQGVVQSRSHAELDGAGGRGDDRLEGTREDKYGGQEVSQGGRREERSCNADPKSGPRGPVR